MSINPLAARIAELDKSISDAQAERRKLSDLLESSALMSHDAAFRLDGSNGMLSPAEYRHGPHGHGQNYFATKAQAAAWGEAFQTILLLCRQPGSVEPKPGRQYALRFHGVGAHDADITVYDVNGSDSKFNRLSPCFADRSAAEHALQAVGEARIIRMFQTFATGGNL